MTDSSKTSFVVGVAVLLTLAAVWIRPQSSSMSPDADIGTILFGEFEDDPLAAKSLEVLRYNEDLAEIQQFKVAEIDGLWCIPSHNNYPADAENQIRDAATILTDLKILGVATDLANEHSIYGVVEPDPESIEAGEEGVGTLIVMQDKKGEDLARLVVGKQVKGVEEQRFARHPAQDRVYVVKIDPDKLSTKFEDWIETDLLEINTWDVKEILIKDYSVETAMTLQGPAITNYSQRMQMRLSLADSSDWKLEELLEDRGGSMTSTELLPDEELDNDRLRKAKDAFDDLEIVDVERKPPGLSKELSAETDFMSDADSLRSLFQRGFYPVDLERDGQLDLLCGDGEVLVRTDDGVEYVLRFGEIEGLEDGEETGSLNRYLFVMARLWAEKFPDLAAEAEADGVGNEGAADRDAQQEDAAQEDDDTEEEKPGDDADESTEEDRERDEQQEKLKTANEKIAKMNDRFANWYYVISEDVFKNIHLSRNDVIKTKTESKEGFDVGTFRELEQELEKKDDLPNG